MPTPQSEQIQILNQITKLIDDKVTKYKKEMKTMPTNRFYAEKKIILDTTTLKDVQKYIENYSNIDSFPQKENAINEILLVVDALQELLGDLKTKIINCSKDH
jgi:hypothetical protein